LNQAEASVTPESGALRLEVVAGKAAGFTIVVDDRLVIGRHSEGPGRLANDPELSRHHAQILREPGGIYKIEDLASTNGTIVNGTRLDAASVLASGDSIEVGGTTLVVRSAPVAVTPRARAVDVRAATVIVDTPAAMRSAESPALEAEPPSLEAESPSLEAEPPALELESPAPMAAPEAAPEPPAPQPEPPVAVPELPAPTPEPFVTFEHDLGEPLPPTEVDEPGPPTELNVEAEAPRIELRLVVELDRGEAEVRLEDGGEPVRLSVHEGRWQVIDGGA
jgi:FHA domain